jgi:hypothetical protein
MMTEDTKAVVKKWSEGGLVWTAELGGMGPGYEQAIQILLFEILARWPDHPKVELTKENYHPEYIKHVDLVVKDLESRIYSYSGAQVAAAKNTAYQFLIYGYDHMMDKLDLDRKIMVSRKFPSLENKK